MILKNLENSLFLKGNPVNLICQNINYYMGGTKDIWNNAKNKFALNIKKENNDLLEKLKSSEQKLNDKKLEFLTYSSGFDLGLEKIHSGYANKVYQGSGPFVITFKKFDNIVKFF